MHSLLVARPLTSGGFESLDGHTQRVADLAGTFAARFGCADLGRIAGLYHDLGKAKPEWQSYIRGEGVRVPHAAEGARWIEERAPGLAARLLAFAIAGHHAGLANGSAEGGGRLPLQDRLAEAETVTPWFSEDLSALADKPAPLEGARHPVFAAAFLARMLFSCLVDADRLASEAADGDGDARGWLGKLDALRQNLERRLSAFPTPNDAVGRLRAEVQKACRAAASESPGLFSLTVPTGGGKTLSSLAFALDHASRHGLDRIVYVIPFTSIVEQTADVFRDALGDADAVLEHHSGFEPDRLSNRESREDIAFRHGLAAENWDRPVIVTTAVQFFESLFAASPSRCRKLHRLARSVIVLDEAQTLPLKLLRPCLAALDILAQGYGASVVLCTATQPAVTKTAGLSAPEALEGMREIIPDPAALAARLKRVVIARAPEPLGNVALAEAVAAAPSGLVIVNSRAHALDLFTTLRAAETPGARHLSTTMTPNHRRAFLAEIRRDLAAQRPARVVSTSLIEAGVDISFHAVWRAVAGIDAIAQAAGRCNRGGELGDGGGRVTVFEPLDHAPPPELKQFAEIARVVLDAHDDILQPAAVAAYFRGLIWARGDAALDGLKIGAAAIRGVMAALKADHGNAKRGRPPLYRFSDIADAFRLIEESMAPIIIPATASPFGAPEALIDRLKHADRLGGVLRDLQGYAVQIPVRARGDLILSGQATALRAEEAGGRFVVLEDATLYDALVGLDWRRAGLKATTDLMFGF